MNSSQQPLMPLSRVLPRFGLLPGFLAALVLPSAFAVADAPPVSYFHDVKPLLDQSCNACHKPEKSKGELDMTTYAVLLKGGKHGAAVVPGDVAKSKLMEMIGGPDPDMPKDADPLKAEQVSLLERWIVQGAKDDTPPPGSTHVDPPIYMSAPVVSALAWSPDGSLLAVSGWHEVLLHKSDGSAIVGRLTGECPRIESIAFSSDGKLLAVAGAAPAQFGQVQIWDVATQKAVHTYQPSADSLYGISFSPDNTTVAVGGADKVARRIRIDDGKILTDFKAHADWVMGTCFTLDGKQIVTIGRDRAAKLIDVASGGFIDDINNPLEPIICLARHPKENLLLYGGALGGARLYTISDNQKRTSGRNDANLLTTFERQPAAVTAVAFSPAGDAVGIGTMGAAHVYARDGHKLFDLAGNVGPVYNIAWKPDASVIATGSADGMIRLYDAKTGALAKQFLSVPLKQ